MSRDRWSDIWFGVGVIGALMVVASADTKTIQGLVGILGMTAVTIAAMVLKLRSKP